MIFETPSSSASHFQFKNEIAIIHFIFQLSIHLNIAWTWLISNTHFIKTSCEVIIEYAKNGFCEQNNISFAHFQFTDGALIKSHIPGTHFLSEQICFMCWNLWTTSETFISENFRNLGEGLIVTIYLYEGICSY